MKLVIAIIQDEYISKVVRVLMENKIRTTKLASTGGFLKAGSTTLFIGIDKDQVDHLINLIEPICKSKTIVQGGEEIKVGGANLFVLPMEYYVKI